MNERTSPSGGADRLRTIEDALSRVAVVVCELEIGETSMACAVAFDFELDLQAAVSRATALDSQFQVAVELDYARDERLRHGRKGA